MLTLIIIDVMIFLAGFVLLAFIGAKAKIKKEIKKSRSKLSSFLPLGVLAAPVSIFLFIAKFIKPIFKPRHTSSALSLLLILLIVKELKKPAKQA